MPVLNTILNSSNTYDAIVIGSGMSGGWAAKELCEKGLNTLTLEKGRMVEHITDYPTMLKDDWQLENRGALTHEDRKKYHVQIRSGFVGGATKHFMTNDLENPYKEVKRFDWIRGNQTGGRSLLWGKHCYRWSDLDFEANAREGIGGPSATRTSRPGTVMWSVSLASAAKNWDCHTCPTASFCRPWS
jgi:choline dehydrogenase-like flavoprotein